MNLDFQECRDCASKPGMPLLCESCRHNRDVIDSLKKCYISKDDIFRKIPVISAALGFLQGVSRGTQVEKDATRYVAAAQESIDSLNALLEKA